MERYFALSFSLAPVELKRWLVREGQKVDPQTPLFSYDDLGQERLWYSPVSGIFKLFLAREGEKLASGGEVAILSLENGASDPSGGRWLKPEEAKQGLSYAEAASIRLPPRG